MHYVKCILKITLPFIVVNTVILTLVAYVHLFLNIALFIIFTNYWVHNLIILQISSTIGNVISQRSVTKIESQIDYSETKTNIFCHKTKINQHPQQRTSFFPSASKYNQMQVKDISLMTWSDFLFFTISIR